MTRVGKRVNRRMNVPWLPSMFKKIFSKGSRNPPEPTSLPELLGSRPAEKDAASAGAAGKEKITGGVPLSPQANVSGYLFEDFVIFRTLGTGSFGRVNLVQHRQTHVFYAMKKIKKAEVVRLRQVEHTNNERALLAIVDHPFIVKLLCTFQDARNLYLVLEYVCGGELFSLLRRVRVLPPFVAVFYAAEIVLAIEHLHAHNIVYRDLKPENILLSREGHVKITDFGFAKVVPESTWTLCGTPDYLAPEIVLSRGYGKAVDWYTLGVLVYEMLVGAPPFYHESQVKLYENIVQKEPHFAPGFEPAARDLIERLLQKDPKCRLGVLVGGVGDIKQHAWFKDVNWKVLEGMQMKPPYKPKVNSDGDDSNFDTYPDEVPDFSIVDESRFEALFPDF